MNVMSSITLRGLKKNKVRTVVTIIGIILSAAMVTAVTALIFSMQKYMINRTIADEGYWHASVHNISYSDYEKLKGIDGIKETAVIRGVGFSYLNGNTNEYKPYLYLMELDEKAFSMMPVYLREGRLPQNNNEIVISEHIRSSGGVDLKVGSTLSLEIGDRVTTDGIPLTQDDPYLLKSESEEGEFERLEIKGKRTFTIVGEMERLPYSMEGYSSPGYTIITLADFDSLPSDKKDGGKISVYFTLANVKDVYDTVDKMSRDLDIDFEKFKFNNELLRFMGVSNNDSFMAVLYSLGAILIGLIVIGSVSLIYNSFSISVSERTKQFGLLSSVGATSSQIRQSVFYEAFFLALVGIPLGVLGGLLGIQVTLYFINDLFNSLIRSPVMIPLKLSVSPLAIAASIIIALITIIISAYIPARRSGKVSAVEAIRLTADIKLKAKQVKTLKITRKLFGLEGDLALKNMKRNKRRYRSTVISLFISVVLFISASAFSMYLRDSVINVYENEDYDLHYYSSGEGLIESSKEVYDDILSLESVGQGSFVINIYGYDIQLPLDDVNESFRDEMQSWGYRDDKNHAQVSVKCVDHASFISYIKSLGLDESQFSDADELTGIVVDRQHFYDYGTKKFINSYIFKDRNTKSLTLKYYSNDIEPVLVDEKEVKVAAIADTTPFGLRDYAEIPGGIVLIIDENSMSKILPPEEYRHLDHNMYFGADEPFTAEADIKEALINAGLPTGNLNNVARILQANRNIITIISIFSYGFIILISLITIANVFNTISTNVNLRRREFAMLKSVGMTDSSFNRMLNFECIFYGLKALLYGLPISILITYLIYMSIGQGVEMAFYLPVRGILISVFSVFLVVFVSMMYSMSKIRRENILDALKNENL